MKARWGFTALASVAVAGIWLPAGAQSAMELALAAPNEQQEADYRVIAARCGTPAFEKAFFRHSRAAVAAGLVSKGRDPVDVEKSIAARRRSPLVLVATPADCPSQLAQLKELQKKRSALVGKTRGRGARTG
ncbi:hypothetical protein J7E62_13360 [Variovorax paradoxus]|nr:hypothetical protein [Variovorax paradoxus]